MRNELTLAVLLYVQRRSLNNKKKVVAGHHFVDKEGRALPPDASSIPKVFQRCVGGAIIEALTELGLEKNASRSSHGYAVVMYALGDSLGTFASGSEKIAAVMKVNNEEGYDGIRSLIGNTAERLYRGK